MRDVRRIPELDGLRGLAILLVVASHTLYIPWQTSSGLDRLLPSLVAGTWGWVGVDLFFVLSGFLITGILLDTKGEARYFRNFYLRRVLRIFPLYFGFLAFSFWVLPYTPLPWAGMYRKAHQAYFWTYTINFRPDLYPSIPNTMGHLWSLCVEEHFYLLWPLLVWLLDARALERACLVLIAAGPMIRAALGAAGASYQAVFFLSFARFDAMAWGGLVACLARAPGGGARWRGWACAVFWGMGIPVGAWLARHGDFRNTPTAVFALGLTLVAGCFAGLVGLVMTSDGKRGWVGVLRSRILRGFGKYSYGIYMLHPLVSGCLSRLLRVLASYMNHPLAGGSPQIRGIPDAHGSYMLEIVLYGAGVLSVSSGLAYLSWHVFEERFLRLKARLRTG